MKYVFMYNGFGWFLKTDSTEILDDYLRFIWDIREKELVQELKQAKDYQHTTSEVAATVMFMAKLHGTNPKEYFQALKAFQSETMKQALAEGMTLYVNSKGGCTFHLENIMNRYETKELCWPVFTENDIRIKKWPGGSHYYAYVGPVQVKCGNTLKWSTEEQARDVAMFYVNGKR